MTLTTMPSAKPSTAPSPMATRTLIMGMDVHRRGDLDRSAADPLARHWDVVAHSSIVRVAEIGDRVEGASPARAVSLLVSPRHMLLATFVVCRLCHGKPLGSMGVTPHSGLKRPTVGMGYWACREWIEAPLPRGSVAVGEFASTLTRECQMARRRGFGGRSGAVSASELEAA
jgi:hypothetical protein